jgi:dihydropteroate synthase
VTQAHATLGGVPVGGDRPVVVVGALNVSPESFYTGSIHRTLEHLTRAAGAMVEAGAAMIDVGARSTAPYGRRAVGEDEERRRLGRAVEALVRALPVPVSADTTRPSVAAAALDAGAAVLNDVSGLRDPALAELAAGRGASVILMASPDPQAPPRRPDRPADDPVAIVRALLAAALDRARAAGIPDERVVLDPGIGFFREEAVPWDAWDARIVAGLTALGTLGRPLCVGVSRKSFLGALCGRPDPAERLAASLAATAVAVVRGAAAVRTHDVPETVDAVRVAARLRAAGAA